MASSSNSILLSDVQLKGKITEKDDIILGCKFDGNIVASKVTLSNSADITGDVNANEAIIEGNYDGELQVAGTLSVSSSGIAKGDIRYKDLEIALGGKISGTISEMSDDEFSKSKIKLVKDEENKDKKSGGGFFGSAKEDEK
jgi:cytoskeletal protein CcmA (bactofilin family)